MISYISLPRFLPNLLVFFYFSNSSHSGPRARIRRGGRPLPFVVYIRTSGPQIHVYRDASSHRSKQAKWKERREVAQNNRARGE